jgi:hypothetical protein
MPSRDEADAPPTAQMQDGRGFARPRARLAATDFVHVDALSRTSISNGLLYTGSLHTDGVVLGIAVEQAALDAADVLAGRRRRSSYC